MPLPEVLYNNNSASNMAHPEFSSRAAWFYRTRRIETKEDNRSMANHVSSLKRARQTETKTAVNRNNKSRLRTALRGLRSALEGTDKAAAETSFRATVSVLDKAVQKGALHKNTASRYKSRLAARVQKASAK